MTVAAIWYDPEDECIWAAADTRISSESGTGTIIRTDSGAKLFPLAVVCNRLLTELPHTGPPLWYTTMGYAFAGDVLPALMTHATASALLNNLAVLPEHAAYPPRIEHVVETIRRIGEKFAKDSLGATAGQYGRFEAAVFGWCSFSERHLCFHIKPVETISTFQMVTTEIELISDDVVLLGSGSDRFKTALNHLCAIGDGFGRSRRLPKIAIEQLIAEDIGNVGGSLSLGLCNRNGFQLMGRVSPIEQGYPSARATFNGIDLSDENQQVGNYLIAINSMA